MLHANMSYRMMLLPLTYLYLSFVKCNILTVGMGKLGVIKTQNIQLACWKYRRRSRCLFGPKCFLSCVVTEIILFFKCSCCSI